MDQIVCIRTYKAPELLQRFLNSLSATLENSSYSGTLFLAILDDSDSFNSINQNKQLISDYSNKSVIKYHFINKSNDRGEMLGFIFEHCRECLKIFNEQHKMPDLSNGFLQVGGGDGSSISQQLCALIVAKKHNLNLEKTIISYYDDDIILKNIHTSDGHIEITDYDYFGQKQRLFAKDTYLSFGKYLHHHGNIFVDIERFISALITIINSKYTNTLSSDSLKIPVFYNKKYEYLDIDTLVENTPEYIDSFLARSATLNPILPNHYNTYKKATLVFDEGNYSILAKFSAEIPMPSFFSQSYIVKNLLELKYPDFKNKVATEEGVVHIRPKQALDSSRNYVKTFTIEMLNEEKIGKNNREILNFLINNKAEKYTSVVSNFVERDVSAQEIRSKFSTLSRDKYKIEHLQLSYKYLESINNKYAEIIPEYINKAIKEFCDSNLQANKNYTIANEDKLSDKHRTEFLLDAYLKDYKVCWNDILNLDWQKKFCKEPL